MINGRIIRGIGGFYYVLTDSGEEIECKARGHFRKDKLTPTVGDLVEIEKQNNGNAAIVSILERKNIFERPAVSNIDLLLIVLSAKVPEPDFLLCDKLIINASLNNVKPVLILNKCDIADEAVLKGFRQDYKLFPTFEVSAHTTEGLSALIEMINGSVTCLAGQSAVGKSSLINALLPGSSLETGGLSRKTDRGKHTTRKAELIPAFGGAIVDTPGFSLLDVPMMDQDTINRCYPEFAELTGSCRFPGCRHIAEPDCSVKEAVKNGSISKSRYERYILLANEAEYRRKHQYD